MLIVRVFSAKSKLVMRTVFFYSACHVKPTFFFCFSDWQRFVFKARLLRFVVFLRLYTDLKVLFSGCLVFRLKNDKNWHGTDGKKEITFFRGIFILNLLLTLKKRLLFTIVAFAEIPKQLMCWKTVLCCTFNLSEKGLTVKKTLQGTRIWTNWSNVSMARKKRFLRNERKHGWKPKKNREKTQCFWHV